LPSIKSARKVQILAEEEASKLAGMVMAMDGVMASIRYYYYYYCYYSTGDEYYYYYCYYW